MLLSTTFTAKCQLVFVLTQENGSFRGFNLKLTERTWVLLKRGTRDFYNSPLFTKSAYFYLKITSNFERFERFLKNKTLFAKKLEYRLSFKSTTIERERFPCKTDLSKLNVKSIRMGRAKWTYHKGHRFASNYLIVLKP